MTEQIYYTEKEYLKKKFKEVQNYLNCKIPKNIKGTITFYKKGLDFKKDVKSELLMKEEIKK